MHVEILCEASDLQPRIARIANPYGVRVFSGAGYDGLKGKRAMAERASRRDRPTFVLHIGDRDDHGERIYHAVAEDVIGWAGGNGVVAPVGHYDTERPEELTAMRDRLAEIAGGRRGWAVVFARLALTAEQAGPERLDLLDADGKAEVDAVPVPVMDGWVREAIETLQDPAGRERHEAEQERERERLPEAIRAELAGRDDDDEEER